MNDLNKMIELEAKEEAYKKVINNLQKELFEINLQKQSLLSNTDKVDIDKKMIEDIFKRYDIISHSITMGNILPLTAYEKELLIIYKIIPDNSNEFKGVPIKIIDGSKH